MKELIPALWDDLEILKGQKVQAQATVTVGYKGQWVELDLTTEHAKTLENQIGHWMNAGHRVAAPARVVADHQLGSQMAKARKYNKAMRKWADEHDLSHLYTIGAHDKIYWTPKLKEAYASFLETGVVPPAQ